MKIINYLFNKNKFFLNCRGESPKDCRDFVGIRRPTDKKTVDWRKWCKPVEDQGSTQSCVYQGQEAMISVPINILRQVQDDGEKVDLDAFEAYYDLCKKFYKGDENKGSLPRDGMKHAKERGILELSPFTGKIHKIGKYWRCKTLQDIENSILTTGPLVAALKVYPSFFKCTGVVHKPSMELMAGLHQVCLVARLDGCFILRNSWGPSWGQDGYALITDDLLMQLGSEFWAGEYQPSLSELSTIGDKWMQ